jgi:GR25 family glycosyltransferase involved in LPS biosynthesis
MLSKIRKIITYDLPSYSKHYGLLLGLKKFYNSKISQLQKQKDIDACLQLKTLLSRKKIIIISSQHCLFIAHLIANVLHQLQYDTIIASDYLSQDAQFLHIVIAPQIPKKLPPYFIAFQMEQSVSSRWFTDQYFKILKKSLLIFDYSLDNISYLVKNGIALKNISFLPISYNLAYRAQYKIAQYQWSDKIYNLCFYGDTHNNRRQQFIKQISEHYHINIFQEIFAADLITELAKAKIVLNIHYYDNALLETTRIYECLSLDILVISEQASDQHYHNELNDLVDFTPANNIEKMIERIDFWQQNPEALKLKIEENHRKILAIKQNLFETYFQRFLAAYDCFPAEQCDLLSKNVALDEGLESRSPAFYCLSITETPNRKLTFLQQKNINHSIIFCHGIKHLIGWVGCGMSFQYLIRLALKETCDMIIICEDDAVLADDFSKKIEIVLKYLKSNREKWDIYSAMIVDFTNDTKILSIDNFHGEDFIFVDKIISMVFNIYNKSCFHTLMKWDEYKKNSPNICNTIDEYIKNSNLKFVVSYPFLVTHKEDSNSTIWGHALNNGLLYNYRFNNTLINLSNSIKHFKQRGSL